MIGDMRWGGLYGVDVDFIAMENCKLCTFREEAIQVPPALPPLNSSSSRMSSPQTLPKIKAQEGPNVFSF